MAIVIVLLLLLVMGGKASISAPGAGAGIRPPASTQYPPGYTQYAPNPYAYQAQNTTTAAISSSISALGSFFSHQTSASTPPGPSAAFTNDGLLTPSFAQPDAGATASYNNLSTSDLDTLASGDQAMGVEGPF